MDVTCEHCKTRLSVPDEKIPKGQMVRLTCPKCKNKITLDTRKTEQKEPIPAEEEYAETGKFHLKFIEPKRTSEGKQDSYSYDDYSDDEALDFFEEGTKLALVMGSDEDYSEKIKIAVEDLGYRFVSTPNTRDSTGKMRFHHFDLIVLCDGFDGQGLEQSPVLNYLNHINMSVRRRIFLALLGDKFKTTDNMMAFAMSANVVINTSDIDSLSSILKKAILDNDKFYKVFMDTLVEEGKA